MFNIQFHPRNSNSEVHPTASSSTVSTVSMPGGPGGLVAGRALAWVTRPVVSVYSIVSVVKRKLRQRELVSEHRQTLRHNLMSAAHQTESSLASRSYLSEETSV